MSALEDYADIIRTLHRAKYENVNLSPHEEFRARLAILALSDELESLQPDATLGALVRDMEPRMGLLRSYETTKWACVALPGGDVTWHDTPEAALREALKEQDECIE